MSLNNIPQIFNLFSQMTVLSTYAIIMNVAQHTWAGYNMLILICI